MLIEKFRKQESGTVLVLMAAGLLAIIGFAALSIDVSHLFQQQREIQSATDAAALAGVLMLTNKPDESVVVTRALTVAQTNGLTDTEIHANSGAIQVGTWNTNTLTFTASSTKSDWNAVRVPAERSVDFALGRVVGTAQRRTAVHSVAMLTGASSAYGGAGFGTLSFGVERAQATNAFYKPYTISKGDVGGSGNFGQLGLIADDGTQNSWSYNMVNGCDCTLSIGQLVDTITGKNGGCPNCTPTGFTDRMNSNPYAVMPVVEDWPSGNSGDARIVGFIGVKILAVNGNGNWTITVENVPIVLGGTGGASTNAPNAWARVLVQ